MKSGSKKVLAISSGGGHLTEMLQAINGLDKDDIVIVTCKTPHTKHSLSDFKHSFLIDPHNSLWLYLQNAFLSLQLLIRWNPDTIISTGSGIAIFTLLLGKLSNKQIIFIETGARVLTPSKTGKLAYRFSDIFIVQYESMLKHYPNALVGALK